VRHHGEPDHNGNKCYLRADAQNDILDPLVGMNPAMKSLKGVDFRARSPTGGPAPCRATTQLSDIEVKSIAQRTGKYMEAIRRTVDTGFYVLLGLYRMRVFAHLPLTAYNLFTPRRRFARLRGRFVPRCRTTEK
jgi:hypothetical protein